MQLIKKITIASLGFSMSTSALPGHKGWYGNSTSIITQCNLDGAVLPLIAEPGFTEVSAPAKDLTLTRVVLGKGTQNYTCASSTSWDKPQPNGAKAELYDVSCLAVQYPKVLHSLPGLLLDINGKAEKVLKQALNFIGSTDVNSGFHFFSDKTSPVFDFKKQGKGKIFVGKKLENVPAPSDAGKGEFGAVDWLKLDAVEGTNGYKLGYRVVTAGGVAPESCEGRPMDFEIPYATEYWFYD